MADWIHRLFRGEPVPFGTPARAVLGIVSRLYASMIAKRNWRFDHDPALVQHVGVPVISIGNLTTGGTGKTPLVVELVRRLAARGCRVGVISRGYRATRGTANDEELLVRRRCPGVAYVANPDRVAAAKEAIGRHGCDCLIADDAFQHRRLARDLDIVVIDALRPFGYDRLLPRGMLREPVESLGRADLVVVSRVDQVSAETLAAIDARIRSVREDAPIIHSSHRAAGFRSLDDATGVDVLPGMRAVCFAAIGNPEAFAATLRSLGIDVVGALSWPDHHQYTRRDGVRLAAEARRCGAEFLLTTEKDAVKLNSLAANWSVPVLALRIEIAFDSAGEAVLGRLIERTLPSAS